LDLKNMIYDCIVTERKILPVNIISRDKRANLYCRIYLCIAKQFRNKKRVHIRHESVDDIVYRLFCAEIVDVGRESNPSVTRRILIEEQRRTYDLEWRY